MTMLTVIPIAAAIFLTKMLFEETQYQSAKRKHGTWGFPAGSGFRLLRLVGIPVVAYARYKLFGDPSVSKLLPITLLLFCILALVAVPREIVVDQQGVHERGLVCGARKSVVWDGASAGHSPGLREVIVVGSDGTSITHGPLHVGQHEFVSQLRHRGIFVQHAANTA